MKHDAGFGQENAAISHDAQSVEREQGETRGVPGWDEVLSCQGLVR